MGFIFGGPDTKNELADKEFQEKSLFEFVLIRNINPFDYDFASVKQSIDFGLQLVKLPLDYLACKFNVHSIEVPDLSFEYESLGATKIPVKAIYPETVKISLLETEDGFASRYVSEWRDSIAQPLSILEYLADKLAFSLSGVGEGFFGSGFYHGFDNVIFNENQLMSKRLGILMLLGRGGGFELQPLIKFQGLKYKSQSTFTISHKETDILIYELECSVDMVDKGQLI